MNGNSVWGRRIGSGLHVLVGAIMILAGTAKVAGLLPPAEVEKLGLGQQIRLIGVGELVSGLLLIIPRTTKVGILLTSSFWGGAICLHMSRGEAYVGPAVLLLLSWAGTYLRENGFALRARSATDLSQESERATAAR